MPDHVHMLIRKHRDHAETMIDELQNSSRYKLIAEERRAPTHPVWAGGRGWKVFLYTAEDFVRVIEYILQNPIKAGRPAQNNWWFVKEYGGWMPGKYY